jgi:hypothetical protein
LWSCKPIGALTVESSSSRWNQDVAFLKKWARERWPNEAPNGHRLFHCPELVIPAHEVVVEHWNDPEGPFSGDVFVAGDPSGDIQVYDSTPLWALKQYEGEVFRAHRRLLDIYTGIPSETYYPLPEQGTGVRLQSAADNFTRGGRRWRGRKRVSA